MSDERAEPARQLPELIGSQEPRVGTQRGTGPSLGSALCRFVRSLGEEPLPWQELVSELFLELDDDGSYRWSETALVVARQNGKSAWLRWRILYGIYVRGERIIHTAQNRAVPRKLFDELAASAQGRLRPLTTRLRQANGQEEIRTATGGSYEIVAPRPGAVRGLTADVLIIDETREHRDNAFVGAARPILRTSSSPQTIYASNAGDPTSVVLNRLRDRGRSGTDSTLAYAEWSAEPDLALDDPTAWAQANPSLGFLFGVETLRADYESRVSDETFATESLCRWVAVAGTSIVSPVAWADLADPALDPPSGPVWVATDLDGDRQRGAVVVAWELPGGRYGVDVAADLSSSSAVRPEDLVAGVVAVRDRYGLRGPVAYDPWTSSAIADQLGAVGVDTRAVTGREWVQANADLVAAVRDRRLAHYGRPSLAHQLAAAERRETVEGRFWMTKSSEPIPAATALARVLAVAGAPPDRVPTVHA